MALCKKCGIDLGEGNEKCPLCDPPDGSNDTVTSPADLFSVSKTVRARHIYEITMLLLVSGVIITTAIDAVFGKGINWSLMTTISIGFLIAMVTGFYFLWKQPFLLITVAAASTITFLWFIDHLTGNTGWFKSLAVPLIITISLLTLLVILLNSRSKYRGFNLLATILLALAFLAIVTEYLTDKLLTGVFTPQWSVVTAASLFIIAMIFVFIHYRLKQGRSLGRMFHV